MSHKFDTRDYKRHEKEFLKSDPDLKALRDENDQVDFGHTQLSFSRIFQWVRAAFSSRLKK